MKYVVFTFVAIMAFGVAAAATPPKPLQFTVGPTFTYGFGYGKYVYDQSGWLAEDVFGSLKSELEFPLQTVYGGMFFRMGSPLTREHDWAVELSVTTNLADPSKVMKDSDWETAEGIFSGMISYTESNVDMRSSQIKLEGYITLTSNRHVKAGFIGGYRRQHFAQNLIDLTGTQVIDIAPRRDTTFTMSGLVGKYKATYSMPHLGLFYRLTFSNGTSAELRAAAALFHASDEDDHVLRNRLAKASGNGSGFIGGLTVRHLFGKPAASHRLFAEFVAESISLSVDCKQTMYWYGDDPISDYDDTGMSATNVPHEITSQQKNLTVKLGMTL